MSEPASIVTEEDGVGKLTFSYQTYLNTDYKIPRAFMKGKFELEDYRDDAWPSGPSDDLRICMHLMGPYTDQVELLKWEYSQ